LGNDRYRGNAAADVVVDCAVSRPGNVRLERVQRKLRTCHARHVALPSDAGFISKPAHTHNMPGGPAAA
jgi:hypothetical protein